MKLLFLVQILTWAKTTTLGWLKTTWRTTHRTCWRLLSLPPGLRLGWQQLAGNAVHSCFHCSLRQNHREKSPPDSRLAVDKAILAKAHKKSLEGAIYFCCLETSVRANPAQPESLNLDPAASTRNKLAHNIKEPGLMEN